jgi:hypothetical protein
MVLFSLTTTKIVHYSSLTYMPLSFLAAVYLTDLVENKSRISTFVLTLLALGGFVFSFLLAAVPFIAMHKSLIIPYLHDPFAVASLNEPVNWSGLESFIGIGYFILVVTAVVLLARKEFLKGILFIFYSTAVCLFVYLLAVVPKIERYSQGPAIDFYESLKGKNVYIWPIGFKSYAQYFYAEKTTTPVYGEADEQFLLKGSIKVPAYFVVKITNASFDTSCLGCLLIKQEGGFKFYERSPVQ